MAATMDDNQKEKNIRVKLLEIDNSLDQNQTEGTAFLCAALVPSGKVYRESIDNTPIISQCYTALKEEQKTQPNALNILLYSLVKVGCDQKIIAELHQVMYERQETSYKDIVNSLSDEDRRRFQFFWLLYEINSELPKKEKISLINLSACYLKPKQSENYTKSLFVHFMKLIEQEVISETNMLALYHWLTVMGKNTTLKKIDKYNNKFGLPDLRGSDIPGRNIPNSSTSIISSASAVDSVRSTSATSVEGHSFTEATQDTTPLLDESGKELVIGNTTNLGETATLEATNRECVIKYGPVFKDKPRFDASAERKVDVIISNPSRFSLNMANLDMAHLTWTFTPQIEKFNFTLQSQDGRELYSATLEPGHDLSTNREEGYRITVSAMAEVGQATICNLQPEISYKIVIDALNENGQCTGSATATIPSTTDVPSTTAQETHNQENGDATVRQSPKQVKRKLLRDIFIFLILSVLLCVPFIVFFVYTFPLPNTVTYQTEIQGNNTVAFQTTDVFIHRRVEVSLTETQNPVEIFSASGHCNRLHTSSRPYSYSWQQDASFMNTYSITTDYFAVGSELMFQANITAKVDRFNCSSAVYIFDDSDSYINFLGSGTINNFVGRLCFNLSRNGSYYNQVQSYSMKESSFLYIGLYLPPISIASHVDLSISGTQNFIVADLTSRCNLSSTKPTCKFTLSTNKLGPPRDICILGRGSSSNTKKHVTNLKFIKHFPNDVTVVMLLSLSSLCSAIFFFFLVPLMIFLCIKFCRYHCRHKIILITI